LSNKDLNKGSVNKLKLGIVKFSKTRFNDDSFSGLVQLAQEIVTRHRHF
jgi:hypothetical protein